MNMVIWKRRPKDVYMVATHPYSQNPAKNGYFDMAFQPLRYQNGLISQWFFSHSSQRGNFTVKQI